CARDATHGYCGGPPSLPRIADLEVHDAPPTITTTTTISTSTTTTITTNVLIDIARCSFSVIKIGIERVHGTFALARPIQIPMSVSGDRYTWLSSHFPVSSLTTSTRFYRSSWSVESLAVENDRKVAKSYAEGLSAVRATNVESRSLRKEHQREITATANCLDKIFKILPSRLRMALARATVTATVAYESEGGGRRAIFQTLKFNKTPPPLPRSCCWMRV
ncbi:hypothetical protein V1477_017150, partial [Vespula maculifrons]